jgi:hypothetical protein
MGGGMTNETQRKQTVNTIKKIAVFFNPHQFLLSIALALFFPRSAVQG